MQHTDNKKLYRVIDCTERCSSDGEFPPAARTLLVVASSLDNALKAASPFVAGYIRSVDLVSDFFGKTVMVVEAD